MFGVDLDCPYLCADCYELGCAFCDIQASIEDMYDEDEYEEEV